MPHITIDGWEYRDGFGCDEMVAENQRRFGYLRRAMAAGETEATARGRYEAAFPAPRPGQRACPDCGQWSCEAPHS